jgi:hypothetical protein
VPPEDADRRWKQFEELGSEQVRKNIASHVYGEENTRLAREWLAHTESVIRSAADAEIVASSAEQIRIARSAKNAAWIAAIAAIAAAIVAAIAAVLAYSSIK